MFKKTKAGILSLALLLGAGAGCQTRNWAERVHGERSSRTSTEKYATEISYNLQKNLDVRIDGKISTNVTVDTKDYFKDIQTSQQSIYNVEYEQKQKADAAEVILYSFVEYPLSTLLFAIPQIHDTLAMGLTLGLAWKHTFFYEGNPNGFPRGLKKVIKDDPSSKKELSRRKVDQINDRIILREYPTESKMLGKDVPVRASSPYFLFEDKEDSITRDTNKEGNVSFTIKPKAGFLSEDKAKEAALKELREAYEIDEIDLTDLKLTGVTQNNLALETIVSGAFFNDKKEYQISTFYKQDVRNSINEEIKNSLRDYLSTKFPVRKVKIDVRDLDSRVYLDWVELEARPIKSLTETEVLGAQDEFLKAFLKNKDDFEKCRVNPGSFIKQLPKRTMFRETFTTAPNVPADYDIQVTHPDYFFVKKDVAFDKGKPNKTVLMSKLREKIDVKESKGQTDSGSIEDSE